jgi:putative tryptophan/tyrosine transport system substrate-binding protein
MIDRRAFVAVFGGAILSPTAHAQSPGRIYRVAVISPSTFSATEIRDLVFPELARLGFVEGRNLTITMHVGAPADLSGLARAALTTNPEVVIASTNAGVRAVLEHSKIVPIVMAFAGEDPVATGLAVSMAKPSGNVTGLTNLSTELAGKNIALLHEAVPTARRIALLAVEPVRHSASVREMKRVAATFGLEAQEFFGHEETGYATVFAGMRQFRAEALAFASAPEYLRDSATLARFALDAKLPAIGEAASMVRDGCLLGYGVNRVVFRRRAADFVAQILRGTPPGDIPIEQPTVFQFAINLKTAKLLGLTIPTATLLRADEVIE